MTMVFHRQNLTRGTSSSTCSSIACRSSFSLANIRFSAVPTGALLLLSYVALTIGVRHNYGFYTPFALLAVVGSFLCLLGAAVTASQDYPKGWHFPSWLLFLALLLFLLLGARRLPGIYLQSPLYAILYFYCTVLLIPLLAFAYLFPGWRRATVRRRLFGVAVLMAFAFRAAMPFVSPAPVIDVFTMIQESARSLLDGKNPYDTPVPDVYGRQPYGFLGYAYPPASLYPLTIGYALFGDARFIYFLSEVIVAVVVWSFARQRWKPEATELLVLLFLFQPQSLFVLEQSWTQPLVVLLLSLTLLFKERKQPLLAAAFYGYMLSTKQELLFFAVHWFLIERRWRYLALGVIVGGATFVPFLLRDPLLVFERGIWTSLVVPIPQESLGIPTLLRHIAGFAMGPWTGVVAGGVACVGTMLLSFAMPQHVRYLFATTITTFALFLFGTHAYTNNYYLVSALIILLLVVYGDAEGGSVSRTRKKSVILAA